VAVSFTPGDRTFYTSDSLSSSFSGVFEDDGDTGYFYAYDRTAPEDDRILDACHIYDVARIADRDRRSVVAVVWTNDETRAPWDDALLADFDV
jgi:hypothetical protein